MIVAVEPLRDLEAGPADRRRAARRGLDLWLASGRDGITVVSADDPRAGAAGARLLLAEPECAVPEGALGRALAALTASEAEAVVPAGFYPGAPRAPEPYLTLWELDELAAEAGEEGTLGPVLATPPLELRRAADSGRPALAAGGFYAHSFRGRRGHARPEVAALVPRWAQRILDVGCADGLLGESLEARGADVLGVEPDAVAAANAARRIARVLPLPLQDALGQLRRDECFDAVVMADVLEHLPQPLEALRLLAGRVAEDGVLVLSVPNASHASVLAGLLMGRWDPALEGIVADDHRTYAGRSGWDRVLRAGGFRVDRWVAVPLLPARLERWLGPLSTLGLDAEDLSAMQWLAVARPVPRSGSAVLDPPGSEEDPLAGLAERLEGEPAITRDLCNSAAAAVVEPLFAGGVVQDPARETLVSAVTAQGVRRRLARPGLRLSVEASARRPLGGLAAVVERARAEGLPVDEDSLTALSYRVDLRRS